MAIINSRAVGVDTLANRPAFGTAGRLYYATDTNLIYEDTGAAWINVTNTAAVLTDPITFAHGGHGQTSQTAGFNALGPFTTKGDQDVSDGTNVVRVGVGTNGQEWIPDSSDAEGIVWRTTIVRTTGDQSTSSVTPVDVTDLSIPIAASRNYMFDIVIHYDVNVVTEGPRFSVNGPASPTNLRYGCMVQTGPTSIRNDTQTAYDSSFAHLTGPVAIVDCYMRGVIENGSTAGNFVARMWTENGAGDSTRSYRGGYMMVREVP